MLLLRLIDPMTALELKIDFPWRKTYESHVSTQTRVFGC